MSVNTIEKIYNRIILLPIFRVVRGASMFVELDNPAHKYHKVAFFS